MKKHLFTAIILFILSSAILAGEVRVENNIEKNSEKNEYKITSVYSGLIDADFVKIRYKIPTGIKTITPSSGGSISKKESDGISFYSLSVDASGVITTLFYIQPSDNTDDINIEVSFVYASGEEKVKPPMESLLISLSNDFVAYSGDTPDDKTFVIKDLDAEKKTENTSDNNSTSTSTPVNNTSTSTSSSNGNYSIQLLSLNNYSDDRVMRFCLDHNLNNGDLIRRQVGGVSKVSIGRYFSKEEAKAARRKMIGADAKLDGAFIITLE